MARPSPRSRSSKRTEASAFSKRMTNKNTFPPIDVQAVGARSNDKPTSKPRKGLIETTDGGLA